MARKIKTGILQISDIEHDLSIYPRMNHSWQTSWQYSEEMKAGAKFPKIVVAEFKDKFLLIDGFHRLSAYKNLKKEVIECEILIGLNKKEMFEEAIKRNIAHGLILSPYDKRNIALKLKNAKYSLRNISELIQVPIDKVESFISQRLVNSITGDTIGEAFIVKSGLKHLAGKTIDENQRQSIVVSQGKISVGSQILLLDQMISYLEERLFDFENEEVIEKLKTIKKLI